MKMLCSMLRYLLTVPVVALVVGVSVFSTLNVLHSTDIDSPSQAGLDSASGEGGSFVVRRRSHAPVLGSIKNISPDGTSNALNVKSTRFRRDQNLSEQSGDESNSLASHDVVVGVAGRVLGPASRPIEGALIQITSVLHDFYRSTLTDSEGRFVLTALPPADDYRVEASSLDNYGVWLRENLQITSSVKLSIALARVGGGRLVGTLVDYNQLPLPEFPMRLIPSGSQDGVVDFASDASGYFVVDNIIANKISFVSHFEPRIQINSAGVAEDDEKQLTLVVNVGTHEFSGRLVGDESQNPVANAEITMTWQQQFGELNSRVSHTTKSDADGHFHFSKLGDGQWQLRVKATGFQALWRAIEPAALPALPTLMLYRERV